MMLLTLLNPELLQRSNLRLMFRNRFVSFFSFKSFYIGKLKNISSK